MRCRSLALLAVTFGCRGGLDIDDHAALVKASPATLSTSSAWALFDRSTTSGFTPGDEPVRATFERGRVEQVSAVKVYGAAPYRLRVTGADNSAIGFSSIDLSKLSAGWHVFPSSSLVSTNVVELHFDSLGAPAAIPELELWVIEATPSRARLISRAPNYLQAS